ncbi:hypothetical protein [Bradyrhizobium betae]|uniref:SGNH/GDSL hydrolase family protein n=1 Tax=Bradyrhizobium betae TaxID=244734 RepID=A0A5P6NZJ2_9BRAD|nr:hypothetical protein [Bradyrhizobium betae]MCS3725498.1 hypothetical protein [Bradyrhizobium betae]QFI71214.1 hypothetical protein F8237_01790 [Bradyrhizobium betae]
MKRQFLVFLALLLGLCCAQADGIQNPPVWTGQSAITMDVIGDSRMADIWASGTCNSEAASYCGTSGVNWFAQASALASNRYQVGVMAALSGCRTDQYLQPSNIAQIVASKNQWVIIGYPAVNDLNAAGGSCTISPSGGAFPFTNANGVVVDQSNVASVAAGNLQTAINAFLAAGKNVILTEEPGNTLINNTGATIASFNGQTTGNVLTVNSVVSGTIRPRQILVGAGVTSSTQIVAQLTGAVGGVGTYSITSNAVVSAESMTTTYSPLSALYELISYQRAIAAAYPGRVFLWSANPSLWKAAGSATAVSFVDNVLLDNVTHFNNFGASLAAARFNSAFQNFFAPVDFELAAINSLYPTNEYSYITNPLFTATSGGTNTTCTLSSGTVPSTWTQVCGTAGVSVTITNAASTWCNSAGNCGNDITFAITTTGADTWRIQSTAPSAQNWDLSYFWQGGAKVSVANGSSNCSVYGDLAMQTDAGTRDSLMLYGAAAATGGGTNNGPTTAYTFDLKGYPTKPLAASTSKTAVTMRVLANFTAAGSCTITVSRAFMNRVFNYNPATGTFSGWLLMRDLDPASNDNAPAWLLKAG